MKNITRLSVLMGVLLFFVSLVFDSPSVNAAALQNRSLQVSDARAGATGVTYTFSFDHSIAGLGSISALFCTTAVESVACVAPVGLDLSSATLTSQTGETGFSLLYATPTTFGLTRSASIVSTPSSTYTISGVKNPSAGTVYVRIKTFVSTSATGSYTDYGATSAGIVQEGVSVKAIVPPYLEFCVAVVMPGDCSTGTGSVIDFGRLNSTATAAASSVFQVATNADFGYAVQVAGTTMYSGLNPITAVASPDTSKVGTQQFGFNLRKNTSPNIGAEPQYQVDSVGVPEARYNTPNQFTFASGDIIAKSVSESNFMKFTNSYIINIPKEQPAGYYATTLTYICTASF
jgi:hypothetical protein